MRKVTYIISIVLLTIFSLPTSSFAVANYYLGTETLYFPESTQTTFQESTYYSNGGDYKLCFRNVEPYNHLNVTVRETDEAGNPPETVLLKIFFLNDRTSLCTTFNVDPYVDGSNNVAELEFSFGATSAEFITVDFYD